MEKGQIVPRQITRGGKVLHAACLLCSAIMQKMEEDWTELICSGVISLFILHQWRFRLQLGAQTD